MCGWTLARAHARSGDAIAMGSYLGGGDRFDQAMCAFAAAYADQNERDFAALTAGHRRRPHPCRQWRVTGPSDPPTVWLDRSQPVVDPTDTEAEPEVRTEVSEAMPLHKHQSIHDEVLDSSLSPGRIS